MIVVDSAVLVYCAGGDHPLRQPCQVVIEAAASGRVEARSTIEVIQEFAWVFAARRPRSDAVARAQSFAVILSPLFQPGDDDLEAGLAIFESTPALGSFDAVLAATAMREDAVLVSPDGGFGTVPGLRYLNPSSPSFLTDLDREA